MTLRHLSVEFSPDNFKGLPQKLEQVKQVIAIAPIELSKVKRAYDNQSFLSARQIIESLNETVKTNREYLSLINAHLPYLEKLRQQTWNVVEGCKQQARLCSNELQFYQFTTALATDNQYQMLAAKLEQLSQQVQSKPDWNLVFQDATQLLQNFQDITAAIKQHQCDYQKAVASLAELSQEITTAETSVRDATTRNVAKQKLTQARAIALAVQEALTEPKSNWAEIQQQADQGEDLARQANVSAQVDKKVANVARASISQAILRINNADRFYGHGVLADLSLANNLLREAEISFQEQAYESAKKAADRSYHAAGSAKSTALSRVSDIEAEILLEQQEERRQEEARRASLSSYNSGGGDYGGGYSGGGGYDGGNSGGGSY